MKKLARICYGLNLLLVVIMIIFFQVHEAVDEYTPREDNSFEILSDYQFTTYKQDDAPIGIVQEYKWTINEEPMNSCCVTFYTIHQEIEIFVDDELVYHLKKADSNVLSATTGCDWARAFINQDDIGKEIRILVYPIYETSLGHELSIYYGDYDTICQHIIGQNIPIIFISGLAIVIGMIFILFVIINRKIPYFDKSIAMLGLFAVFAGLWKLCDMTAAPLIFKNPLPISAIAIIALSMMVVPFVLYIRNQMANRNFKLWDVITFISNIVCMAIILLQLFGIADLRETLIICHVTAITMILCIFFSILWSGKKSLLSGRIKMTIGCSILCLLGAILDMILYYNSGNSGSMIYCLLAFIVYIVLMGYTSLKKARKLIEQGKEAEHYEKLAMHDELTGLYSRAFYSEYLKKHDLHKSDCFIVMLDVNNLKLCNDNIGHACGDQLLKNTAGIIEYAFQPCGQCIRLGGDEFCVLLPHSSEDECAKCVRTFDEMVERFNNEYPNEFPISVAHGYTCYDATTDYDFGDTLRRADKKMYQMKNEMKANQK